MVFSIVISGAQPNCRCFSHPDYSSHQCGRGVFQAPTPNGLAVTLLLCQRFCVLLVIPNFPEGSVTDQAVSEPSLPLQFMFIITCEPVCSKP